MLTKQDWDWLAVCSHYQTAPYTVIIRIEV